MDRISSFIPTAHENSVHESSRRYSSSRTGPPLDPANIMEIVEEVKLRCEREKKTAVSAMMNFMKRKYQREMVLYTKKKEAEFSKLIDEEKRARNDLQKRLLEMQRERAQTSDGIKNVKAVLKFKQNQQVEKIKQEKRKLEEALQAIQDDDKNKFIEMKHLKENYEHQIKNIRKTWDKQVKKLTNDIGVKERKLKNTSEKIEDIAKPTNKEETEKRSVKNNSQEKKKFRIHSYLKKVNTKKDEKVSMDPSAREIELEKKLSHLTQEYEKLKENMVRKLTEAQQVVGPLRQKNRQFIARNLELSARNRELESTSLSLSATSSARKEKTDPRSKDDSSRSTRSSSSSKKLRSRISLGNISTCEEISVEDYAILYSHLQKEYRELCRAYQLLQARSGQNSIQDVEREERQINYYKNKLEAAETKMRDFERCFNDADGRDLIKKLIDEKESQTMKNFQLSEKIKSMDEREKRLRAEIQDAKDQAELLEFRVLELEECQDKVKNEVKSEEKSKHDIATETDADLIDSGCSSLRQSRCSSVTNELEEQQEIKQDFGNEKIHETQQKLHALVSHVQGPSGKSLLIQTVALFEALLTRIKDLQCENEKWKSLKKSDDEGNKEVIKTNDELVLALESLNAKNIILTNEKKEALSQINLLSQDNEAFKRQLDVKKTDMEKREETHRKFSNMQNKIEEDLKREISSLNQKLNSTIAGSRSESEMYEESLLKVSILERSEGSLKQCITDLQRENNELRDQLSSALEHATTKSSGSFGSDFGANKSGTFSTSDVSDTVTHGSSGVWSVASDDLEQEHAHKEDATDCSETAHAEEHSSYIDSLRNEITELNKKLEQAEMEIKHLNQEKHGQDDQTNVETQIEDLQRKLAGCEACYNLLVTACYISSAINQTRTRPKYAITFLSDQDQPRQAEYKPVEHQMKVFAEDVIELTTAKELLEQEIEQLKITKQSLILSEENLIQEKTQQIMILEEKIVHLLGELEVMKDQHHKEKSTLQKELEEIHTKDLSNTAHANYLQNIIGEIEHEFENIDYIHEPSLLGKIRYLLDNESKFSEAVDKHSEKESAFRETLAEADIIMTNIENNYKTKVAELEEENHHLQTKLSHTTDTAEFVRHHLQPPVSDQDRNFVEKMFEKEKNELAFMDKIFKLENTVKELSQKASEKDILKNELNDSIKDQEEIMTQIQNLEKENKELVDEIVRKKEVDFKYQELQQTEEFLRGRVDELEIAEASLRDTLAEIEQRSGARERKFCEEITRLRDEINQQSAMRSTDELNDEKIYLEDESLKMEFDAVKEKLRDLTCHLEEKSKHFQDTESSLRTELCKARSSICTSNKQLHDYDAENCQLKQKLSELELRLEEKYQEVDTVKNLMEQTNIDHSNIVTEKDRQLQKLQNRLDQGTSSDSHLELQELSSNDGGLQSVISDLQSVSSSLQTCDTCNTSAICDKLSEAASQIQCLTRVVSHVDHVEPGDMYRCISEDNILDIDDNHTKATTITTAAGDDDTNVTEQQKTIEEEESLLLESQLVELTEKLDRMESEMVIVSEESKNLQQMLEIKESTIVDQRCQLSELSQLVIALERLVPGRDSRNVSHKIKRIQEPQQNSLNSLEKKEVNLTLLPPENLQILRRVGSDGLLVSWTPPDDDDVTGYLIYVDNEQRQKVRSSNRTKALLHNIDQSKSLRISLHSTNVDEEVSEEVIIDYTPDMKMANTKKNGQLALNGDNFGQESKISHEDTFQGAHL